MIVIGVVFLESLAYFSMTFVYVLMLEEEYGMDDVGASTAYAVFGLAVSVYGILFGWTVDKLRVRKAIVLYVTLGVISKAVLGLVPSPVTMWIIVMGPLSFALAIGGTAILAAIRRYTTSATRNTAFSLRYIAMNVGALLAEPVTDAVRVGFVPLMRQEGQLGYSLFIAMTAVPHLINLLLVLFLVRDVYVVEPEAEAPPEGSTHWIIRPTEQLLAEQKETANEKEDRESDGIIQYPNRRQRIRGWFRKWFTRDLAAFVVLSFGTMGAKSVFRYLDSLYPLWMSRAAFPVPDPSLVPFNTFLMINPIIVILFTAALATFMERKGWHPYWVILIGTTISATAPFWMTITQYWAVILFITQLSIGEISWSPMLSTYSCWFAPPGQEGTFFALAAIPLFGAKAAAGYMSGKVLKEFCPPAPKNATDVMMAIAGNMTAATVPPVPCSPVVWVIVGCVAISSPLIILVFMKCLKVPDPRDRLEDVPMSEMD